MNKTIQIAVYAAADPTREAIGHALQSSFAQDDDSAIFMDLIDALDNATTSAPEPR